MTTPVIEYTLECLDEDIPYRGNASAIDEETDHETETWIASQLARGNAWAWCCAKVTATVTLGTETFIGTDYLGGCSYHSEQDFRDGGYFVDMCHAAREDLLRSVRAATHRGDVARKLLAQLEQSEMTP